MEYRFESKYGPIIVDAADEAAATAQYRKLMIRLRKANGEIARAFKDAKAYLEQDEDLGMMH